MIVCVCVWHHHGQAVIGLQVAGQAGAESGQSPKGPELEKATN